MRVLLTDADAVNARCVSLLMQKANIVLDTLDRGTDVVAQARLYDYDVILLELMLPDIDGFEVVRRLRAAGIDTPVIILSEVTSSQAKVKAFGLGADDYVVKPCDPQELVVRIKALVRRSKGFSQQELNVGPLRVNIGTNEVFVGETPVHLTGKEYAILELLTLRKGNVLTKDAFLNHLYGGIDEPEVKIIDVFICKLRKKLTEAGGEGLIGTVWGRGYVMRDPVAPGRLDVASDQARLISDMAVA